MENTLEQMERIGQELSLYMDITSRLQLHSCKNFQLLASQLEAIKRQIEGDTQTYNTQFINYLLQVTAKQHAEMMEITHQALLAYLTRDPDPVFLAPEAIQQEGGEGTFNGQSNHSETSSKIRHPA